MMYYFLPVIIVICANVTYDICAKSIPEKLNHFAGLTVTYMCLAVFSFIVFTISSGGGSLMTEISGINWAVIAYGIASVGLETGYILLFRAGWNISLGGLVCNILVAVSMLMVGLFIFGEDLSVKQIAGICLCITGLLFINKSELTGSRNDSSSKKLEN